MAKRRLLIRGVLLLILLAGGAIVNVAVAWGCAYHYVWPSPRGVDATYLGLYVVDSGVNPVRGYQLVKAGLPLRSMSWRPSKVPTSLTLNDLRNGSWNKQEGMPSIPIWPGFAINTIFYAAVLWLLIAVPFALRRRLRVQRGLCEKCAYPIGSSPVCTECGGTLPLPSGGKGEGRGEGA